MAIIRHALLAVFGAALAVQAHADVAKARLIQKGLAAFECSIFVAFMSADGDTESERLFQIGYDSSMAFLEAVRAGEVTEQEYRTFVRLDVALNLKKLGKTDPAFAVGRFYQDIRRFAADRVIYGRTESGAIDIDNTLNDSQSAAAARVYYDKTRCALIE
jgi:hypothetical protein